MIRKILFILSILFAFASTMKAQHELTAYEDASSRSYATPVSIFNSSSYTRSQFVIPASELTAMNGGKIHVLKFYASDTNYPEYLPYASDCDVDVYIKEVSYTSMTTFESKASSTIVYQGKFSIEMADREGELTITLNTPYTYHGGNLLIGMENTTKSQVGKLIYFVNKSVDGQNDYPSLTGYNSNSLDAVTPTQTYRVPKTTFHYTLGSEVYRAEPASLTMTDISKYRASVGWAAPVGSSGLTGYVYQYKKANESSWSVEQSITATSVTLTGLTPNTAYNFRVKAMYGSVSSVYATMSFTTDATERSLPYTYSFEKLLDYRTMVDYWTLVDCNSQTHVVAKDKHEGDYSFLFVQGSTSPQYLISPEFDGTSALTVSFWYKNAETLLNAYTETFQVGYSTTTREPSAFTWLGEMTISDPVWTRYEGNFPSGTKYIAIQYTSVNKLGLYIDDFNAEEYNGYAKPANVMTDYATSGTAKVAWTAPAEGVTGYGYQYKKTTDESWSTEVSVTTTSVTISGLTPYTDYEFRVRAQYGSNRSSYAKINFTTTYQADFPFTDGFEDGLRWTMVDCALSPQTTGIKTYAKRSGSNGFDFIYKQSGAQYLISPEFNGGSAMFVSFWYRAGYANYSETFQVGYSTTTNAPSAFIWGSAITTSDTQWKQYGESFPAGTKYVAIRHDPANLSHLYLDDFSFTTLVTNPIARNVAVNPLHTSATITWEGASDSYIVKHRIPGERTVFFYDDFEDGTWDDWSHGTYFLDINVPEAGTGVGGGYGFLLHGYGPLYFTRKEYLISPELSGIPEDAKLSFYYRNTDGNFKAKFQVGYSTTTKDENAFTLSNQVIVNSNTDWLVYEQTLPANVKYITVVCLGNLTGTGYLYLDDICIDQTTPAGAWTTIPTTKESLQITGLTPGTQYDYQIVGVKDDVENAGTAITTFTTLSTDEPLELALPGDNTPLIEIENGVTCKVKLNGRGLYKDGDWNTLCLPFDVTTTSAPLSGDKVVAMVFDTETSSFNDGTLTLNFTPVTSIPAGTPFIIKWDSNWDIGSPEFSGVTVDKTVRDAVCDLGNGRSITFRGTYKRLSFDDTDTSILFLGAENTLYYPLSGASISAQRAYFQLEGVTAGEPSGNQAAIRSFQLNLEDEATDIVSLPVDSRDQGIDEWYTLDGRKLKGKPTKKGIYIHHHRKVVVK